MRHIRHHELSSLSDAFSDWKFSPVSESMEGLATLKITLDCGHEEIINHGDILYAQLLDHLEGQRNESTVH